MWNTYLKKFVHKDAYISTQAGFSVVSVFNVMLHDFELIF